MAETRIALCITDLDVGGAEQALVALATRLNRTRFQPAVYCLGPKPEVDGASCVPPLRAADVDIHFLGARRWSDFPFAVRALRGHFAQSRPDLVQTFLFHANIVGRIAARQAGVPGVVCGIRVAERQSRWHLWLDRLTSRWVQRYVCVSQSVAQFSAREAGLPPSRLTVIPNGVDLERFPATSPASLVAEGIPPGSRIIAFVGRLDRQKGLDWLLESAPEWLPRVRDCHLVLVGQGPERSTLERIARQRGIAGQVHWLGWRKDIAEILAASDLLVLPSRWEGMPNVVLQAMASQMPVVATDVEGVRELLGENAEPQVVAFGQTSALAEKLVRILSDNAFAGQLGRENRTRCEQNFSIVGMVHAYEDLWQTFIAGKD